MKIYFATILLLILGFSAFGQTDKKNDDEKVKPDFSGTWVLDRTKTKKIEFDLTLIVAHREPEMKVTKIYNFSGAKKTDEQTYYTDGRRVPDKTMDSEIVSVEVRWMGDSLVRKYQVSKVQGKMLLQANTEKWELSKDGKTLTLTLTETISATTPNQNANPQNTQGLLNSADTVRLLRFKRGDEEAK